VETRRRYTEDSKGTLVELNCTAHHVAIVLKMAVPKRIGEHNIRSAVRAMLIGRVNESAKIRPNAQYVEVVPADSIEPNAGWIFSRVQPCLIKGESCQTLEAAVAIAEVEIVGIRLRRLTIAPALNKVKALRLRHTQRAQDQCIQYAKN